MSFLVILWVLVSLLVAYLGRHRAGGFWGTLFFSLVFTPLVAGLALILMRDTKTPGAASTTSGAPRAKTRGRRADAAEASPLLSPTRWAITGILIPWLGLLVVFAIAFWVAAGSSTRLEDFRLAATRSLTAGTLSLSGEGGESGLTSGQVIRWIEASERIAVILLIATAIARFLGARQLRLREEFRDADASASATISSLEARLKNQQQEIEQLRGSFAGAAHSPATEVR